MKFFSIVLFMCSLLLPQVAFAERYLSQDAFLKSTFEDQRFVKKKLWLTKDIKQGAKAILKHDYNSLRVGYWGNGSTTAWVLEEIGKERPITIGVAVKNGIIQHVKILEFRESRGWEVRYPFFTDQFKWVGITEDRRLNKTIDGVSGATLSVRAVKKVAALAVYLHSFTEFSK